MSAKIFGMSGKFFEMTFPPSPRRQHFREKMLGTLLNRKVPLEACPPQLLDASYAPVT